MINELSPGEGFLSIQAGCPGDFPGIRSGAIGKVVGLGDNVESRCILDRVEIGPYTANRTNGPLFKLACQHLFAINGS